jgi:hypothetical protein
MMGPVRRAASDSGIGVVLGLKFVGANDGAALAASERLPGEVNYFTGNEPSRWRTGIPTYGRLVCRDLYPGVELAYFGSARALDYDLMVMPGANPSEIGIAITGADRLELNSEGDLLILTALGTMRQLRPSAYQEGAGGRQVRACRYVLGRDNLIRFGVEGYDPRRPLVIDPPLMYSTLIGGKAFDNGNAISLDAQGNAYVTGDTNSVNFPTVNGSFQVAFAGGVGSDAFVTKIDSSGSALVYSTYLGGKSNDIGFGIAVDAAGAAYLAGYTTSSDFPVTAGVPQNKLAGIGNAFVAKLDPAGKKLVYSTYLGGSGNDSGHAITIDRKGTAFVTGFTTSQDFPVTAGALETVYQGGSDAFVARLSPNGKQLMYSTFLGGSNRDEGNGIAVDGRGCAYVAGETQSGDFPVTANALQPKANGPLQGFISKLNPAGSGLLYSTYLGGKLGLDSAAAVAVDNVGRAYVTGSTSSPKFPVTPKVFQGNLKGFRNAFVSKLSADGTHLVYSTYLGGGNNDWGAAIAVDANGNAYIVGSTNSPNFPTTLGAFAFGGGFSDSFVSKLDPTGAKLVFSTYLGGADTDEGTGVAIREEIHLEVDRPAQRKYTAVFVEGLTRGAGFPVTPQAFQNIPGGLTDAFVTKIAT